MANLTKIAQELAVNAKATGFDLGDLYDDAWNLTDAEWHEVCNLTEQMIPVVKVPASVYAAWAQVDRDYRAEQRAERIAFGGE